ncbi:DNA polymerase alpha/epsilon subunit B-domain-containing protein [Baffinella frigidus]|nr:DNA polymerase alpha/epsilon subunit B-domain-containing protein [Cryptophyta sp. CCMP2293]
MVDVQMLPQELLAPLSASEVEAPPHQVERTDVGCDHLDQFFTQKKSLAAQYSDLYFMRLQTLKPDVAAVAAEKWKGNPAEKWKGRDLEDAAEKWKGTGAVHVDRILEIPVGQRCFVVGTIYKEMSLKPNILTDITNKDGAPVEAMRKNFVDAADYAIIEDDSGRITLDLSAEGVPACGEVVTGLVIAMLGTCMEDTGVFTVEEVCYSGLAEQPPAGEQAKGASILLVSGLQLGDADGDPLAVEMLVDYVTGNLGGKEDHSEAANIVKVIIAGGSCYRSPDLPPAPGHRKPDAKAVAEQHKERAAPVRELDILLTRLSASVAVDVMPGDGDPTNAFLPQQPFHACLLPSAGTYSTFRAATNPYAAVMGKDKEAGDGNGVLVVGSSGQNVDDVMRYSTLTDAVDVLDLMLNWRHLAPTAPDTLPCFPTKTEDPFVLSRCPHVFFAGNQVAFGSRALKGPAGQKAVVISVPCFATTATAVLVNLETLAAQPLVFSPEAFSAQP